jgi:hypothetical protein
VTPIARKIIEEDGLTDRVTVVSANVVNEPLSGCYDVAVLRALLQVLSPEEARAAIRNISAGIRPGGTIYIVGQILDDSRTSPLDAVGFNLGFINTYEKGESYTEQEHRDWLSDAGFSDIERAPCLLADGNGLITARKKI